MTASIETPTIGLGELISGNTFSVPRHQRDYSWDVDYADQFLDDIEKALEEDRAEYFFGLMVFTRGDNNQRLNVIDGQQRLATALILFSAVRNWMWTYPDYTHIAGQIYDRYISHSKLGFREGTDRLELNATNHDYFNRFVVKQVSFDDISRENTRTGKNDRNKRLIEVIQRVHERVSDKAKVLADHVAAQQYFVRLLEFVNGSVRVVSLIPGGDEDAYTIFETLNDRGLELAPLDLVKNLLFSRAESYRPGSLPEMEARWNEMMTILERTKIDAFLKTYWASRYSLTDAPKLFKAFKGRFDTAQNAYKASVEMREVAENYVALHDPNDPVWSNLDPKDRLRIESISYIGATQLHPLILSAIEKFSKHDLQRLLHLIEVVAVRYQLVARGRPGRMESLGSQAARKIFAGEITSATQVRIELSEIYPTDETFRQDFLQTVQKDKVVARYMLRMLEQQGRKARSGGLKDVGPEADLTLEHIMPRTLTPKWRDYLGSDAERHAEYRNRIGNLCLLGKANKKLGNSLFTEKVGEYSKSGNQTTSSLKEFSEWRCAQIDDRQAKLADFAVQAWRFN